MIIPSVLMELRRLINLLTEQTHKVSEILRLERVGTRMCSQPPSPDADDLCHPSVARALEGSSQGPSYAVQLADGGVFMADGGQDDDDEAVIQVRYSDPVGGRDL